MRLKDKSTVEEIKKLIGRKGRTRTSRHLFTIDGIEFNEGGIFFIVHERNRERRILIDRFELAPDKKSKESNEETTPKVLTNEEKSKQREELSDLYAKGQLFDPSGEWGPSYNDRMRDLEDR